MTSYFLKLVNDHQINGVDGTFIGVSIFAWLQWIPHLTALLSLIWISLRLWVTIRDDFINKGKKKDDDK